MRDHFLLDPEIIFLNHGSFGACPKRVLSRQRAWQAEMERNPVDFLGRRSGELLGAARSTLADYLGAKAHDLAFLNNATVGVNVIAQSVQLAPGDQVLATNHEYGACEEIWRRHCARQGAQYRTVHMPLPFQPEQCLELMAKAITPRTRVLYVSHISSPTALVFPVAELIELAHRHHLLVAIDGAHAPGQIDLELDRLDADFYTGNCHKWMCAPKGAGFLHVREDHHECIRSPIISWGQVEHVDSGPSPVERFTGDSKLERQLQWLGTRDISAFLSVPEAISFMKEHDWDAHRRRCRGLALEFQQQLEERLGAGPLTAHNLEAQMAAVALPKCDGEALRDMLLREHQIELPISGHEGRQFARASFQAYNTEDDLQRVLDAVPKALGLLIA